jgi:hypothetical protein
MPLAESEIYGHVTGAETEAGALCCQIKEVDHQVRSIETNEILCVMSCQAISNATELILGTTSFEFCIILLNILMSIDDISCS